MRPQCFLFFAFLLFAFVFSHSFFTVHCQKGQSEPSVEDMKAIFCTKKMRPIVSLTYAPFACLAEVMGANFSKPDSEMPKRFTSKFHPSVAKWSVLHTMESFMEWYCGNFQENYKIVKETKHDTKHLSKDENAEFFRCIVDEFSVTIEEEICINKTPLGKSLELERYKCLREVSGKSDCLKEMMTDDVAENKFNEWLCQEEPNVEKYVTTKFVCLSHKDQTPLKYNDCVNKAVSKLLKT